MGGIKAEVEQDHLAQFKNERSIIETFCSGFEISWARERKAYNTSLSVYILTPDKYIRETFGFNTQLALFMPHFKPLQPRLFQAIDSILHDEPLKGRVDRQTFFLLCETEQEKKIVSDYVAEHSKTWIPIVLTLTELEESRKAKWGIRNPIAIQIFTRDLFDQQLPLISDVDFFGRDAALFDFKDAISKSQNRGIFGLRKTGKTSLLFKLMRNMREYPDTIILYYDCKKPLIRQQNYQQFLELICSDISESLRLNSQFLGVPVSKRIELIASHVGKKKRICIIFDEIEYVSFLSKMDTHWHRDYINLWQTLWSLQSEYRNFCYIVSGVNPTVVERDNIEGVQNPLFGIVPHQYLTGLNLDELRRMLHILGRRMGLYFDDGALRLLHNKYGGHPLLTRKACSSIHSTILFSDRQRPFDIDGVFIEANTEILDDNMEFYFKHILSELEAFYPDEYEMLKMSVSGQILDFAEMAKDFSLRRHLENYGRLSISPKTNIPFFLIDCLRSYLERETARDEKRPYAIRVSDGETRARWLSARSIQITKEMRALDAAVREKLGFSIFPHGSMAEPEEFVHMPSAHDGPTFERFINVCYKSVVEEIDRAGRAQKLTDFFFRDI